MTDRINVLFLSSWYPNSTNRMHGIFVREHAQAASIYDDVTVIHCVERACHIRPIWQLEQENDPDLSQNISTYHLSTRQLPFPGLTYPAYLYSTIAAFMRFLSQHQRPDIIHAHIYRSGVPAVILGRLFHIPVIITEHSSAFPRKLLPPLEVSKAKFAFRNAKIVLTVSKIVQQGIESYGIRSNFRVIPNAVDGTIFFPPETHRLSIGTRFLFVGSLVPVKGLSYLFDALQLVNTSRPDWRLDIIGDGPERENYEQQVRLQGLDKRVNFYGFQSKPEIAMHMREADYFVLPSLWETQGCVLLEALNCGLPIIATSAGGIPEMIDKKIGVLVPPGDSSSLAEILLKALNHELCFNRRDIVITGAKYLHPEIGKSLHNLYRTVITNSTI